MEAIRPEHYKTSNGKQLIDLMVDMYGVEEAAIFCKLNAQKYIARCEKKHATPFEDIDKAIRYLQMYKQLKGQKP